MNSGQNTPQQNAGRIWHKVLVGFWVIVAVVICMLALHGIKPREAAPTFHDPAVYQEVPTGMIVAPFSAAVQPMERLLLINFEEHGDPLYVGLEPQVLADHLQGSGFLVVAWRTDGYVDVYHQPGLTLDPATYDIAGLGVQQMVERPLEDAFLDIRDTGVDTYFAFEDTLGRAIAVTIQETSQRQRRPFGLLAPMGDAVEHPTSLPLVFLDHFYFVRRQGTHVSVTIADTPVELGGLPLPMDLQRMYFLRYSPEPLIIKLNPAYHGVLEPLPLQAEPSFPVHYEIADNQGYLEIRRMQVSDGQRQAAVSFEPPLPNVLDLRDGAQVEGAFTVRGAASLGTVGGVYQFQRSGSTIRASMTPSQGWQPRMDKLSLRALYAMQPLFRSWPQTYVWEAVLDVADPHSVHMASAWRRQH